MQTKAIKSIHNAETCKAMTIDAATLRLHMGELTAAEVRIAQAACRLGAARIAHLAETYMAAVECYNENPWDRANVRKYAAAKDALRDAIHAQPNA